MRFLSRCLKKIDPYGRFPLNLEGGFLTPKNAGYYPGYKEVPKETVNKFFMLIQAHYIEAAKLWSGKVKTKWEPKEGIFKESAEKIASYLKKQSKDLKQAMSRLNFFINRGGENLSASDKKRLDNAKEKLRNLYKKVS